jgi:hypothetical protein
VGRATLAVLLCLLGCAAAGGTRKAGTMDETKVVMEPVTGVEDPGGDKDGVLKLKDGTSCTLGRQDKRFSVWLRILGGAQKSGMPVYVACAPGGAAQTILPMAARTIEQVGGVGTTAERTAVQIFMAPSIHFLTARHAALRPLLEEAVKTQEPLLLAVEPGTREILGARKPPEGLEVTPI